jgi:AraC-like DNA-binding protein
MATELARQQAGTVIVPGALRPHRRSTAQVARRERFGYWQSCSSLVELEPPERPEHGDFAAEETTWRLGRMALMSAEVAALRYRRTPARIRRDGLDHWCITIALRGERHFATHAGAATMRPGTAWLSSLGASYEVDRSESRWVHLFVPHDDMAGLARMPPPTRAVPLDNVAGRILHDFILCLAGRVAELGAAEAARMERALSEVLAAALAGPHAGLAADELPAKAQRLGVRRRVRENLHLVTFGPERLARLCGISRSQLYRLFEPWGGVAAFIQAERLHAARRALSDPAETRPIAAIAESVGLCDPSSFGRMFQRAFGCPPRDWRRAERTRHALAAGAAPGGLDATASITELLRGLETG